MEGWKVYNDKFFKARLRGWCAFSDMMYLIYTTFERLVFMNWAMQSLCFELFCLFWGRVEEVTKVFGGGGCLYKKDMYHDTQERQVGLPGRH